MVIPEHIGDLYTDGVVFAYEIVAVSNLIEGDEDIIVELLNLD